MLQQHNLITPRPLQGEADFWRVRDLLITTYPRTPLGFNWDMRRWDGKRFHHATDDWLERTASQVQLWETVDGQLVGLLVAAGDARIRIGNGP